MATFSKKHGLQYGVAFFNLTKNKAIFGKYMAKSEKSPTGPTERTPKPEYLIALATYLGVRW